MPRASFLTWLLAAAAAAIPVAPAVGQLLAPQKAQPPSEQGVTIGPEGPVRPAPAPGQPAQPDPDGPQVFKLAVSAAAEPGPPLRYQFTVPFSERQPGNSVPFYYRALVQFGNIAPEQKTKLEEAFEKIRDVPAADLPKDEVRTLLAPYGNVFTELDRAAVREQTNWDWRLEELGPVESISFLLPEIQQSRELARLLALKAKVEVAEGRFDDAARTLRDGYALGRAVAEPPTLINDLVGIAIASVMRDVVRDWIATPGSPNVYWAVTELPQPFVDLRPALEYELSFPYRFAPWLSGAETDSSPPEVWRERFVHTLGDLEAVEPMMNLRPTRGAQADPLAQAAASLVALRGYPSAKRELIARGYDSQRVEAMPVGQVLAIQQKFVDDVIGQEMLKAALLPPAEAAKVSAKVEQLLKGRGYLGPPIVQTAETIPLMSLLAPATRGAGQASWRAEAYFAALRTVEAIRMHAASAGVLPKSLAEIEAVPVPENPTSDEPFAYSSDGRTAVLDVVVSPDQPRVNWRVELTLQK